MVVMSLDMYESLTESVEAKLDEADFQSKQSVKRLSHKSVFSAARARIKEK